MMGARCDGPRCDAFAPAPNPGWFFIAQNAEITMGLFSGQGATMLGTFCSLRCAADFAYVHAMVAGPAAGVEPRQPDTGTGTGWPA